MLLVPYCADIFIRERIVTNSNYWLNYPFNLYNYYYYFTISLFRATFCLVIIHIHFMTFHFCRK